MAKFIDQFLDEGMEPDMGWTPEVEEEQQRERLLKNLNMARHAYELKRRLGGDASPQELSNDKKLAKQVHSRLMNSYRVWGGTPEQAEEAYQEAVANHDPSDSSNPLVLGAQVEWGTWWGEVHKPYLRNTVRIVATKAHKLGQKKIANSFAQRFVNEWNTLDDVLSPLETTDPEEQTA